jgi:hypothetical protein
MYSGPYRVTKSLLYNGPSPGTAQSSRERLAKPVLVRKSLQAAPQSQEARVVHVVAAA